MAITNKTKTLIGMKKYGEELMGAWENPGMSAQATEDGLSDLIEDTDAALKEATDAIQSIIGVIMRNPIYNDYTKDELLPMVEAIASVKSRLHATVTDITFAAQVARDR